MTLLFEHDLGHKVDIQQTEGAETGEFDAATEHWSIPHRGEFRGIQNVVVGQPASAPRPHLK